MSRTHADALVQKGMARSLKLPNIKGCIVAERFTVGAKDMEGLEALRSRALFDQWKLALQVLAGGLVSGWVLMAATGWIVRGFVGIARGQDAHPDAKPRQ